MCTFLDYIPYYILLYYVIVGLSILSPAIRPRLVRGMFPKMTVWIYTNIE